VTQNDEILDVDARGLLCPLPVLRLEKAFRRSAPNTIARLSATDPAAEEDVRVFCRERGHRLIEIRHEGALFFFLVKKGPA
jgi:tRNA 2-thiouridine synthesizing protein A